MEVPTTKVVLHPSPFNNSKACVVWLLYPDVKSLDIKWIGSVSWRNPRDFDFSDFILEKQIDTNKTGTFAFGPFGGLRESNQTIYDCALAETLQESGYHEWPGLAEKLQTAHFITRDLIGNISRDFSQHNQYASITFFVRIEPGMYNPADECTSAPKNRIRLN